MDSIFRCAYAEWLKLIYQRATHIVILLVVFLQGGLAFLSAQQILSVGLNATPQTNPQLAEPVPPIENIGFDVTLFGIFIMIILGALYGAQEFRKNSIRTSLLSVPNRGMIFITKLLVWVTFSFLLSFVAIFITILLTHIALGKQGLPLVIFDKTVWVYILYGSLSWTLIGILSFLIAFLFRNSVIPMLFLLPQVYNLGSFLASHFSFAKYLPIALTQGLIASTSNSLSNHIIRTIVLMLIWNLLFAALAYCRFIKKDVGSDE